MEDFEIRDFIRDIPDFPKAGIIFKDITPALKSPQAFRFILDRLEQMLEGHEVDVIAGIEARGFIFAAALADRLGVSFVPFRKPGKLPAETISAEYALEYGTNQLELHMDSVLPGERVVIIDDLLATGGTAKAACSLIERLDGVVEKVLFVIELTDLNGRPALKGYDVESLITYGEDTAAAA